MSADLATVAALKDLIVTALKGNRALTFSDLEALPGARGGVDISEEVPEANATLFVWKRVSAELVQALRELEGERRIAATTTSAHHYFLLGPGLHFEDVTAQKLTFKTRRHRTYWLPVAFKAFDRVADWERASFTAPRLAAAQLGARS